MIKLLIHVCIYLHIHAYTNKNTCGYEQASKYIPRVRLWLNITQLLKGMLRNGAVTPNTLYVWFAGPNRYIITPQNLEQMFAELRTKAIPPWNKLRIRWKPTVEMATPWNRLEQSTVLVPEQTFSSENVWVKMCLGVLFLRTVINCLLTK